MRALKAESFLREHREAKSGVAREVLEEGQKQLKGGDSVPREKVSDRILKRPIKIEILGPQDGSMCKLLSGQVWQLEFGSCSPNEVERRELTL